MSKCVAVVQSGITSCLVARLAPGAAGGGESQGSWTEEWKGRLEGVSYIYSAEAYEGGS